MSITDDLMVASASLCKTTGLPNNKDYNHQIRNHITALRNLLSNKDLDSVARDDTLLNNFDPSQDSITYLFLLHLQIRAHREASGHDLPTDLLPSGKLWLKSEYFLRKFDPIQVRYAGHEWRQLVELVVQAAQASPRPFLAVALVRDAMLRLDPSCAVLTSTHLLLTHLSLCSKAYTCALPVLERQISHVPISTGRHFSPSLQILCAEHESSLNFLNEATGLSSKLLDRDYLRYFLYGGMIYLALKRWEKASHFFGTVISMPTVGSVSMIMVEAYKKWIMVGLLEKGKLCPPPNITAPHVVKSIQSIAKPYFNLAQAFESGDKNRLEAEVDAGQDVWRVDNNIGLVSQVLDEFARHSLMKTKKVFAALTVGELSAQTSLSNGKDDGITESKISSLIMSGAIDATLVHSQVCSNDSILRFTTASSTSPQCHEIEMQAQLQIQGRLLESLFGNMEEGNLRLGLSDEFIDNSIRGQPWAGAGAGEINPSLSGTADLEVEEDIMGDLA
ncbi:hypothetical protein N7456_011754 [Penicillium angulare]|uniref:COP9 signalosome complex subunit 3 N-terminal helical repeats domain-containing protein n=1 Tax=Penicillium angulare TaxID=116970 RepID=A0A9W9K036_9EURO|nr:hypothetical protein N7456_011754 [Penicillium angulare]